MTRVRVMTRFGHDPIQNLGHGRDPVMTHNTINGKMKLIFFSFSTLLKDLDYDPKKISLCSNSYGCNTNCKTE